MVRTSASKRVRARASIDVVRRRLIHRLSQIFSVPLDGILLAAVISFSLVPRAHAQGAVVTVEIYDKPAMFRPEHPKIKVGQTILWVNKGDTVHTVTADPSQAPDPSWVRVPPGSEELDSGYLSPGETYSYVFKVPGIYKYFCLTHEQEGMRAVVEVEK